MHLITFDGFSLVFLMAPGIAPTDIGSILILEFEYSREFFLSYPMAIISVFLANNILLHHRMGKWYLKGKDPACLCSRMYLVNRILERIPGPETDVDSLEPLVSFLLIKPLGFNHGVPSCMESPCESPCERFASK